MICSFQEIKDALRSVIQEEKEQYKLQTVPSKLRSKVEKVLIICFASDVNY